MIEPRFRRILRALAVVVSLAARSAFASTWYVDPDATNPATDMVCSDDEATLCTTSADCPGASNRCVLLDPPASWCEALTDLQIAIDSAGLFDTIKVADGTYYPDASSADTAENCPFTEAPDHVRCSTFQLPLSNATIEGGYAGCGAADPDERDFIAFESTFSGDIGIQGVDSDNCLHVITGDGALNSSVLDGFTITAGNASPSSVPAGAGGGMLNNRGSPTVIHCTFRRNTANRGGAGVYNKGDILTGSNPKFFNCIFEENVVTGTGQGGGAYNVDSNPTFTNGLFIGNRSNHSWGGAIYSGPSGLGGGSITTLVNCTLAENFALADGGGIALDDGTPSIKDCIVWGNAGNPNSTIEQQQILRFHSPSLAMTNTCVQGCLTAAGGFCQAPTTNIGNDAFLHSPYFVPGPAGCYYLSDTAAGEPFDSACIDAGSTLAANVALGDGTTLADRTTASDEVLDTSTADLGYHYPDTAAPVDPDTGLKFLLGDFDRNGVVDLLDYDEFAACLTGPSGDDLPACCRIFDYELDGDVDVEDLTGFQESFFPQ